MTPHFPCTTRLNVTTGLRCAPLPAAATKTPIVTPRPQAKFILSSLPAFFSDKTACATEPTPKAIITKVPQTSETNAVHELAIRTDYITVRIIKSNVIYRVRRRIQLHPVCSATPCMLSQSQSQWPPKKTTTNKKKITIKLPSLHTTFWNEGVSSHCSSVGRATDCRCILQQLSVGHWFDSCR